ncbi:MAG: dihydrodipicolinate reductase [Deltaproteobacteria bacterium]|nr:dihydrodipicolinate reductase [Deltaproteobacteria bacterium]
MTFRVIQWATGNVGRQGIEGILAHPELELAGCWVHSEAKVGRDAGELCGLPTAGVAASDDVDALVALDADCVLYSPVMAKPEEVVRLLRSGKNVVTPLDWFFPAASEGTTALEEACREGGATLHGTGIHPGGITERFPLMISAMSRDVRHVRAEEFSDIRTYATEFVVREMMMFGKSPDEAARSPMTGLLGHGFKQSIQMVATALDMKLDAEIVTEHESAVATQAIDTPVGTIDPGTIAAQRFGWIGTVGGEPAVTVRTNWFMGEENLEPAWTFGPEGERFEVEIEGTPSIKTVFHGLHPPNLQQIDPNNGIIATAMHCVNAIPSACRAEPGIKTYLDLPMATGKAAKALRGGA